MAPPAWTSEISTPALIEQFIPPPFVKLSHLPHCPVLRAARVRHREAACRSEPGGGDLGAAPTEAGGCQAGARQSDGPICAAGVHIAGLGGGAIVFTAVFLVHGPQPCSLPSDAVKHGTTTYRGPRPCVSEVEGAERVAAQVLAQCATSSPRVSAMYYSRSPS